jgi:hypothetical protein
MLTWALENVLGPLEMSLTLVVILFFANRDTYWILGRKVGLRAD